MKTYILAGLLALMAGPAAAQFQVGSAGAPSGGRAGSLKDSDLEQLKNTTTVFVLLESDTDRIDAFRQSLADVWTITPFRVVLPDSARFFQGRKYSVFGIGSYTVVHRNDKTGLVTSMNTHLTYDLTVPDFNRHGEAKGRTILGRFMLSPAYGEVLASSLLEARVSSLSGRKKRDERETRKSDIVYRESKYANWGPGQIRGYVKAINDYLLAGDRRGVFDEITEKADIKALSRDTLYLPEYLRNKYSGLTGREHTSDEGESEEDTKDTYPFPHRYVSNEELENLLVHPAKPVYHLIYVRSAPYKFVSVVEARSGKIVYSRQTGASYNFKMKDLKALARHVD
jgi:hypothetical protein